MNNMFKRILSLILCIIMMTTLFVVFAEGEEEEYVPGHTATPEETTYELGSKKDITVTVNGEKDFEFFAVGLFMRSPRADELEIKDDAYSTDGNTFTINSDFLETLEEGVYRFGLTLLVGEEYEGVNVLVNVVVPAEETPSEETPSEETTIPKTADASDVMIYVMIAVVSMIGFAAIIVAKKRLTVK